MNLTIGILHIIAGAIILNTPLIIMWVWLIRKERKVTK
jgi:hypothetical protein